MWDKTQAGNAEEGLKQNSCLFLLWFLDSKITPGRLGVIWVVGMESECKYPAHPTIFLVPKATLLDVLSCFGVRDQIQGLTCTISVLACGAPFLAHKQNFLLFLFSAVLGTESRAQSSIWKL